MNINETLTLDSFSSLLPRFWEVSGDKILSIHQNYDSAKGSPVYTEGGSYTTRGWTEWTEGFVYGSAVLQFDATGDEQFLEIGRQATLDRMAVHVSHIGVHDHGFNNLSTYGNLLRLLKEGTLPENPWEQHFYELAIKISGAVQASRWTPVQDGGFIHSFNGPHSLFVDTIRSCRILVVSHLLGHRLMGEQDEQINLLERAIQHALTTAKYGIYYGEGRDAYDVWGRTAHESIFNVNNGAYRCPNAQQGFSGFSTWTRGLAWAMAGYAELLECLDQIEETAFASFGGKDLVLQSFLRAAQATCDFFIEYTPTDGIPYWDTGAPDLYKLENWKDKPSDPDNPHEPIDSSAAAIGAQGLLRLGQYLGTDTESGRKYWQAGLTALYSLLQAPYLSTHAQHQGLILHAIYHRPNDWDFIPGGNQIPKGESCMWGDYHAREVALYIQKMIEEGPYYTFYACV